MNELKIRSRIPSWVLALIALGVLTYAAVHRPPREPLELLLMGITTQVLMLVIGLFFAHAAWRQRSRAAFEVTGDGIVYASIFRPQPGDRFSWSEIAAADVEHDDRLVLELRSGDRRQISLLEIGAADRASIRTAVRAHLTQRPPGVV